MQLNESGWTYGQCRKAAIVENLLTDSEFKDMNSNLPRFLIIGAMKCATTSLYEQLKAQPGIFMPELKEPNYFSDDDVYSRGEEWYRGLFEEALPTDLCGEASTHYTKLPTYPKTIERLSAMLEQPKLIYIVRHPIERIVSQYIHEWSQGLITQPIDEAIANHPELVNYSQYAMQLQPFAERFGKENILVIQFEHLKKVPEQVLTLVCEFIGYTGTPKWQYEIAPSNISRDRVRRFPLDKFILDNSVLRFLRRKFIPKNFRVWVKNKLSMRNRPTLSDETVQQITKILDADLENLKPYLGHPVSCAEYHEVVGKLAKMPFDRAGYEPLPQGT